MRAKRKRKKCLVIPGDGDPCPRCGEPMQIARWFCCLNKARKTALVMPVRYKVVV